MPVKTELVQLNGGIAKVKDKFPKEDRNSNGICHVRPHARRHVDKIYFTGS